MFEIISQYLKIIFDNWDKKTPAAALQCGQMYINTGLLRLRYRFQVVPIHILPRLTPACVRNFLTISHANCYAKATQ